MLTALARSSNYKWWVCGAIAIATFSTVVDHGTLGVALPTISDHFDTDLPTVQWVIVGYALAISALLLPMGRLSDVAGRKQVFISGLVIFIIGAALAGISPNVLTLILSKIFQGSGTAMIQATGMAMLISVFPSTERGKALGTHMSVVGAGGVAGPAVAGLIVNELGWRWVFFLNVPMGLVAIIGALVILDKRQLMQDNQTLGFDWRGAALSAGALITFLLALTDGPRSGWGSPHILVALLSFIALLGTFIWWELRTEAPMLDLRLFKRRVFSLGVSAGFLNFLGHSPMRFLMPFYLQAVLGFSPAQMGLILVPNAVAFIIIGPLAGRLSDRYGWRKFTTSGLLLSAAGLFILSRVTETSPLGLAMAGMIIQTLGMGMFQPANNSSILSTLEPARYGVVGGLLNLTRNSGNITSIALATVIVTAVMASHGFAPSLSGVSDTGSAELLGAFTSGVRTTALAVGIVMLVGCVVTFLNVGQPKAAPARQAVEPRIGEGHPD